jgi:hypothetical protein
MKFPSRSLLVLGALVCIVSPRARALPDSDAAAGRLVARQYSDAIVEIKGSVIMKINIGLHALPPSERKIDLSGTVIAASGLTLTSLSSIDPKANFEAIRKQMNPGGEPVELGDIEFKNMRLRLADGSEVPVKILWKDPDHDMILLGPSGATGSSRTFTFVDLNQGAESSSMLGNYYQLSRTGEEFQHVLLVRPSTVIGIIERPRRLLIVNTDMYVDTLGCPVFDAAGKVLGICLHNTEKGVPKSTVLEPAADLAAVIAAASPD